MQSMRSYNRFKVIDNKKLLLEKFMMQNSRQTNRKGGKSGIYA